MYRLVGIASAGVLLASCGASRSQTGSTASQPPAIRVAGGEPNTIPVGTALEVLTNEVIDSKEGEGKTWKAEIATDVVGPDGKVLLPKGSPVELVTFETREGGGIRGSSLQLGMRSVTVGGKTYLVISEEAGQSTGIGANRKTAEMVGGGAALGTLIGAAAGGGKGAVIGGLAGAAAGALAQILTQDKHVRIPAETVLRFRLDEPIRLQATSPGSVPSPATSGGTAPPDPA